MGKQEYKFQGRLIKILTSKGFLVINAASKQIFDLVAMKDQVAYPIEVKGKDTPYPKEQQDRQLILSIKSNTTFFVIQQSLKKGKMQLFGKVNRTYYILEKALKEHLI